MLVSLILKASKKSLWIISSSLVYFIFTFAQHIALAITALEAQIHPAKVQLDSFSQTRDTIVELLKLADSVQRVIMNFEFTLAVLNASTQDEVTALKTKFSVIAEDYQNVSTKEDLTPVPAKYAIYVVINKLCPKLKKTLDEAFKKGAHGEIKIVETRETLVHAQITVNSLHTPRPHC